MEVNSADAIIPGKIFTWSALFPHGQNQTVTQIGCMPIKAPADRRLAARLLRPLQTTIYMHEAKREPDADKFFEAMQMEMCDQLDNGNFLLTSKIKYLWVGSTYP